MFKNFRTSLVLTLALGAAGPVLAQADPTLSQIYEAAKTGHLPQAEQMMNQVLKDHPTSAKAHYVAAELYAREGKVPAARTELATAQTLEPGLPFAKAESVSALQRELSQTGSVRMTPGFAPAPADARPHAAIPWGMILIIVAAIAVLWTVMRRRAAGYGQYPAGVPAAGGPGGYGPGYGGAGYGGGPGMGSGIVGGLASGLAVGAGVVAGEELAHHFLDRDGNVVPTPDAGSFPQNSDMGGSDFGVSDGSSWDDGGGSVGGDVSGGDDWT